MIIKGTALALPRLVVDNLDPGQDLPLLLTTKLVPPRLGRGILPRPRLERLAESVLHARLTVLRAPPGYGKSTLASIWSAAISAQGSAVAWLSLDPEDQSVQRLLFYLAAALNRADPALGRACLSLRAEPNFFAVETLVSLLINELSTFDRPVVLFIDDCHVVEDLVLESALGFILQRAPACLQVVLLSRRQLPAGLTRHLYADDLQEIDYDQLRFSLDETRDLLRKAGVELEQASDLMLIQQHTEGWIAALRSFLLTPLITPQGQPRLLTRNISLLFAEQIVKLDASLLPALSFLGLLDSFSEALIAHLFGQSTAVRLLHELEHHQLFLVRLDDHDVWYSLHPMLRSYLKKQCLEQYPDRAAALQQRAAAWFAKRQLWLDAIRLELDAGHSERVTEWINNCALDLLECGDFSTLVMLDKRWQQQADQVGLPLKLARAWAFGLALEGAKAQALLDELEQCIEPTDQDSQTLYWEVQALRAMLLGLADHNKVSGPLAQRCYEAVAHRPWITNVLLNLMSCSHYHAANWDAFYTVPATLSDGRLSPPMLFHDCYRQSIQALAESAQGRLQAAHEGVQMLLAKVHNTAHRQLHRPNPALLALPHAMLAQISYWRGDLTQTEKHLAESIDFVAMGGFLDCMAAAYCTDARLQVRQGAMTRARRTLEQLDSLAQQRGWERLRARVLFERTWLNLLDHKPREAIACSHSLREMDLHESTDGSLDRRLLAHLSALWLALNGLEQRSDLVVDCEALLKELEQRQLVLAHAELGLTLGALYSLDGYSERGQFLLDQCLDQVCSMGAVSLIQDLPLPQACDRLIGHVSEDWITRVEALLSGSAGMVSQACCNALLELTVKERQVMQLVAEGKSNKQIARDLNVTPETIKSHMKSIFAKLKVENRAQAAVMLQSGHTQ